jgi:hypothetical protein
VGRCGVGGVEEEEKREGEEVKEKGIDKAPLEVPYTLLWTYHLCEAFLSLQ